MSSQVAPDTTPAKWTQRSHLLLGAAKSAVRWAANKADDKLRYLSLSRYCDRRAWSLQERRDLNTVFRLMYHEASDQVISDQSSAIRDPSSIIRHPSPIARSTNFDLFRIWRINQCQGITGEHSP